MKFWQEVVLRLLYLTPFGYLLSVLFLLQGEKTKGIYIDLRRYSPIRSRIKQKPTLDERLNWFINGIFLLAQGLIVLIKQVAGDIGGAFALLAFIFGLLSLVSAFLPNFPWNKKLFKI